MTPVTQHKGLIGTIAALPQLCLDSVKRAWRNTLSGKAIPANESHPVKGKTNANRTQRPETASGRDRQCCACDADRYRRNPGYEESQNRQDPQWDCWSGGTRQIAVTTTEDGYRQEGVLRTVGMMPTARAVANYFISKGVRDGVDVDQLKLQKLAYYAYCWYLANNDEKLFDEDIEAWDHGPVVRDLWNAFSAYGKQKITQFTSAIRANKDGTANLYTPNLDMKSDASAIGALDEIWRVYKDYDGIQLSNLSHSKGEPWQIVKSTAPNERRPIISDEIIKPIFKAKLASA
jgi:uncharacterized phage-associated protein